MKKHFIKQFIKIVITLFFFFSTFYCSLFYKKSRIVKPVTIVPSYEIIEDLGYYKPYRRFLFENINIPSRNFLSHNGQLKWQGQTVVYVGV